MVVWKNISLSSFSEGQVCCSRILNWQGYFSSQCFEYIFLFSPRQKFFIEKSTNNLMGVPLYITSHFSCSFQKSFLIFAFWLFDHHCLSVSLSGLTYLGFFGFVALNVYFSPQVWEVFRNYCFKYTYCFFISLCSLWNFHNANIVSFDYAL